jgi:transposase, IS30 family
LAEDDLATIMGRLNTTPRRCLGYRTPNEDFQQKLAALTRAA